MLVFLPYCNFTSTKLSPQSEFTPTSFSPPNFQFKRYTGRVKSANLKNITTPLDKAEETVIILFLINK